jgi:hypothetical protein
MTPDAVHDAAGPPELPADLAFVCCDDDEIPQIFAGLLIARAAANMDESVVLGEAYEETAGLVDRVLDMAARLGDERVVCILDQNLDCYDEGKFQGTALVRKLRLRDFRGLLVIQSANDALDDERDYKAAGADGSIGKAVKGGVPAMIDILSRLYHARFGVQGREAMMGRLWDTEAQPGPLASAAMQPACVIAPTPPSSISSPRTSAESRPQLGGACTGWSWSSRAQGATSR